MVRELIYIPIEQEEFDGDNYRRDHCVCGCNASQFCSHHLTTRQSGGPDEAWNLIPVCIMHHNEFHTYGAVEMSNRHEVIKQWLLNNNWEYQEWRKKWVHLNQ